jgi:drug/metabolite transporter (DMT)-like permease
MSMFGWALLAAFGVAVCNGVAAVLQKSGADSAPVARSLHLGLLVRLIRNWPYMLGTTLDLASGALILFAVHILPLFLAQSIVASSVTITFLIERFILHRYSHGRAYIAVGLVFIGLVLLAFTAVPETVHALPAASRWGIVAGMLPLALLGALVSRSHHRYSAPALAVLAGTAFGGVAIAGRVLLFPEPLWHIVTEPLLYAFVGYGLMGILFFTLGLQRATATALATVMVITETVIPAIVGVLLLGDRVHQGLWPVAIAGIVAAVSGAAMLSTIRQKQQST